MAKLNVYNFITLNGYYKGTGDDISWHRHGEEEAQYSEQRLASDNILVFGRVTYEMMMRFWPTATAAEQFPDVAKGMNAAEKMVFSRTLDNADWHNTRLVKDGLVNTMKFLKETSKKDMTILGSGSIVTQCAEHGLIDTYQIMVDPVALGDGTPMFKGMMQKLELKLAGTRTFKSGAVLLSYEI